MEKEYTKQCPQCGGEMPYTRKDRLKLSIKENRKCRKCCSKKGSIYTSEEKKEKAKIYRDKPEIKKKEKEYNKKYKRDPEKKEKQKKYEKEYRQKPEVQQKIKEYRKKYDQRLEVKEKRKDPIYRLNRNMSGSIWRYLKFNNLSKNRDHWEDIIGYSVLNLKRHIEKQFQPGMSWKNYGDWHIDHRIPLSFFEYTSIDDVEFRYCWSLDNLQPLWAEENIKKADKVLQKYIQKTL